MTCTIRYKIIVMNTLGADIDLRRSKLHDPLLDTCFEHSNVLFRLFTLVTEMQLEKLVYLLRFLVSYVTLTLLKECFKIMLLLLNHGI